MNIDEMIYERELSRERKDWAASDRFRYALDYYLVFVFDTKDGQEVHHLQKNFFEFQSKKIETAGMSKRQYVEYIIKRDVRADKNFDAWLFSTKMSN